MANIKLIRALGSEFIRRKYKTVVILFALISLLAVILVVWLVNISLWWWLLGVPVLLVIQAGIILSILGRLVIKIATPQLSKVQARGVKDFVDKLEKVAENIQTPPFIILFKIVRDTIRSRDKTFIQSVAEDSASLRPDYIALQKLFK